MTVLSVSLVSFLQNFLDRATPKLVWGPWTDPNKRAPPMSQYPPDQKWPDWCRVSSHGPHLVKVAFLDSLPRFTRDGSSVLNPVDNIRLRKLSHYKCNTDWNHEFIRADLVDNESNKPLVMVWERDLAPTIPGATAGKQSGLKAKSGVPCRSIDRVTYITEDDFSNFVALKRAYLLRTANFPTPGPNILELASVLETHSTRFPIYKVYSTMCYWYADSTFEVLAEIGKANVCVEDKPVQKKGVFTWLYVNYVAYPGVTRKSLNDDAYQKQLVDMQTKLVEKYDGATQMTQKAWSQKELAELPKEERLAIEQRSKGWDVSSFLDIIRTMPTHQELFDKSKARAREVRGLLETIQLGQEEQKAAMEREAEAKKCAEIERLLAKQEDKWRLEIEELGKMLQEERKRADELARENARLMKERFGG
ncbi:hypothetical protein B0T16DRAFT_4055 [Cercophora newfieldiana]|uniref:Uncharacterized protein n=1 Tax=Cercophora newfieldiana TaxID=92897 RepID=A0AA39YMA5_9PEZI|nr:hypothetical protein B0T16DRAFT_4055 [Cercophora newfieldiana]